MRIASAAGIVLAWSLLSYAPLAAAASPPRAIPLDFKDWSPDDRAAMRNLQRGTVNPARMEPDVGGRYYPRRAAVVVREALKTLDHGGAHADRVADIERARVAVARGTGVIPRLTKGLSGRVLLTRAVAGSGAGLFAWQIVDGLASIWTVGRAPAAAVEVREVRYHVFDGEQCIQIMKPIACPERTGDYLDYPRVRGALIAEVIAPATGRNGSVCASRRHRVRRHIRQRMATPSRPPRLWAVAPVGGPGRGESCPFTRWVVPPTS